MFYAKKANIDMFPCFINDIALPDELELLIKRIQAVNGWQKTAINIVGKFKDCIQKTSIIEQ